MVQESAITEEMRSAVGVDSPPVVYDIEKGAVKKFALAIEDPNPLYQDENVARKTEYGGIIAPPTFPSMLRNPAVVDKVFNFKTPLKGLLNGGNELEYLKPIKVGDVISVTAKLVDIKERTGAMGKMIFFFAETAYKNQKGEVVCLGRQTLIRHEVKEKK
ncbi:MAG: MaoC family dehydratase N-terminal domain-containing protein [Chloroflexi bacterium]|nr:MaoC family dehydratase N-terminal domain-containing protein [Chloroflexota bacterium]